MPKKMPRKQKATTKQLEIGFLYCFGAGQEEFWNTAQSHTKHESKRVEEKGTIHA